MEKSAQTYPAELSQVDQPLGVLELAIVVDAGLGKDKARAIAANDDAGGDLASGLLLGNTSHVFENRLSKSGRMKKRWSLLV